MDFWEIENFTPEWCTSNLIDYAFDMFHFASDRIITIYFENQREHACYD